MAKSHLQKQSLLQKALRHKKILTQQVLMYQRLMESMRNENSFEDILKLIITSVTQGLGFDRAGIFLTDPDRRIIERVMGIDRHGRFEGKGVEYPLYAQKDAHLFSDIVNGYSKGRFTNYLNRMVDKETWRTAIDRGVFSNAVVPITVGNNKTIGVLAVDNLFTQKRITKSHMQSLMDFATEAGLALDSFRLHEKIRDLTVKDGLTGVCNRRYFDNYFPKEIQRCRRYKRFLSLLYVDLDHFKKVNDLYGHPAGDEVLKFVADRLVKGLRNVDVVVRMGGDEFAVILPEVGREHAKSVAERLYQSIVSAPSPVEPMRLRGEKIAVTLGVACFSDFKTGHQELVRLADESLYQAKTAGRNRVGNLAGGGGAHAAS